jgi:hypothetical protein
MGEIRGILFRTIAGFGVCVLAATAVDRTLFHESFVPVPIDMSADRRVDAYVPFYKRMLPLANLVNGISAIDLRNLADDMILASQSGQLQPIVASFHGLSSHSNSSGMGTRLTGGIPDPNACSLLLISGMALRELILVRTRRLPGGELGV